MNRLDREDEEISRHLACVTKDCGGQITCFCRVHGDISLCEICYSGYHAGCQTTVCVNTNQLLERVSGVTGFFNELKQYSEVHELGRHIIKYDSELVRFAEQFSQLEQDAKMAVKNADSLPTNGNMLEVSLLYDQALKLKAHLDDSYLMKEYSKFRINQHFISIHHQKSTPSLISDRKRAEDIEKFKKEYARSIDADKEQQISEAKTQIEATLKAEQEAYISTLKSEIDVKAEEIEKLGEECKLKDMQLEDLKSLSSSQLSPQTLYNTITGKTVTFDSNYKLEFDPTTEPGSHLLKLLTLQPLPELKKIRINRLPTNDSWLIKFFAGSFSPKLRLLTLNYDNYAPKQPISPYLDSLLPCLKRVTKEIVLYSLTLTFSEMREIVKAAKGCARLLFRWCKVVPDGKLDFGNDQDSKVEHLSLEGCGRFDYSDWGKNKEQFRSIITAIGSSTLAHSLQTLNIYCCEVDVNEVSLSKVNVVENNEYESED